MKKQIIRQLENTAKLLPKSYEIVRHGTIIRHHQLIELLEKGMSKEVSSYDDVFQGVKTLENWYGINIPFRCEETTEGFKIDFLHCLKITKVPNLHIGLRNQNLKK